MCSPVMPLCPNSYIFLLFLFYIDLKILSSPQRIQAIDCSRNHLPILPWSHLCQAEKGSKPAWDEIYAQSLTWVLAKWIFSYCFLPSHSPGLASSVSVQLLSPLSVSTTAAEWREKIENEQRFWKRFYQIFFQFVASTSRHMLLPCCLFTLETHMKINRLWEHRQNGRLQRHT